MSSPSSGFNREPIFWTSTSPGYNLNDRERWIIGADGKKAREKFPQRGHVGEYDDKRLAPGAGNRWMLVVRHDGHEVRAVLTNAAAHLDVATSWAHQVKAKGRFFGWFNPGACPCALLASGELTPDTIVSDEVRSDKPCTQGTYGPNNRCKHSVKEQAARRAAHNAIQAEREAKSRTNEDKIIEAMREQTAAVTNAVIARAPAPAAPPRRDPKGE